MRALLGRLARLALGYGLVQWTGPFVSLVFTPLLTRVLTPGDYGLADYLATFSSAFGTLALLALPQAVLAHYNDRPHEPEWPRRVTGSALAVSGLSGSAAGLAIGLLAPLLSEAIFQDRQYTPLFQWISLTIFFAVNNAVLTSAAQAGLRVRWGMTFSLTTIAATALGNVLFVIVGRLGVLGMVLVQLTSAAALSLVVLVVMQPVIGRPAPALAARLARSGAVLLPATAAAWVLQMADRLFLVHYVSPTELGYYAIANKIASLLFIALAPVHTAWTPLALSIQHQPEAREAYANVARYVMAAVLLAALGLGLFARELLLVFAHAPYLPAAPYAGLLIYVQVFHSAGAVISAGALAGKQFKAITGAVLAAAAVNLLLNAVLIPAYRLWGAAIATVAGYALSPLLLYPMAQRRRPIPYPLGRLGLAALIQVGLLAAGLNLPPVGWPAEIALKAVMLALFPAALVVAGLIRWSEVTRAWQFLARRLAQTTTGRR